MSSRWRWLALFGGAALISGFTILRGGAPFDEGIVLQAARRVEGGQVPYRDFQWAYGPVDPYLLGGWFKAFGTSLLSWRVLRVACDAGVAVLVYALVRRGAPRWVALLAWLAAACAMAQPTSATPGAPALVSGLAAVAIATRVPPLRHGSAIAGALVGLTAIWRIDFGLYAAGATGAALLLSDGDVRARARSTAAYVAAAVGTALAGYLPFAISIGPADLYRSLLGTSIDERDYWTLPFPTHYHGGLSTWPPGAAVDDAKDVLVYYTPLLLVVGLAVAALAWALGFWRSRALLPIDGAMGVFGIGTLLYLLSRTDDIHTTPLLIVLAVALPLAAARLHRGGDAAGRALGVAALSVLALLAATGAANRASALLQPPAMARIDLPGAQGAQAPPREAADLERTVRAVRRLVRPGRPIYTVTARSDIVRFNQPLIYVLSDRDNPTRDEYAIPARPSTQHRIVLTLRRTRPGVVVRWLDPITTVREPNLRGRPSGSRELDAYLAARYRKRARFGDYELLVPRGG